MALADGKSSFKTGPISLHTQTAIHIAEKLANVSTVYIYTGNILYQMYCTMYKVYSLNIHFFWSFFMNC